MTGGGGASTLEPRRPGRFATLVEVSLAFALMHVGFRAFKRFTDLGQAEYASGVNFSPGAAMLLVAAGMILVRRRRPAEYGLAIRPFRNGASTGVVCLLVYVLVAAGAILCGLPRTPRWDSVSFALIVSALNLLVTAVTLWVLSRGARVVDRIPGAAGFVIVAALAAAPVIIRLASGRPVAHTVVTLLWLVLGAGVAEEVFFRGYVQSRVNEAFGRPWTVLGTAFGPGLLVAAALFGVIHVLNPYDYFSGQGRFEWWHGLASASALYFGFLRERTGSVIAPILVHTSVNLMARLPGMIAAGG